MELETDFKEFLSNIRLTANQRDDLIKGHTTLRERLAADTDLNSITVSTFLQGSYRRSTAIRPKNDQRADVDVIVVTTLSESQNTPAQAMDRFKPFLDTHYKGKWQQQGRSFGIELSYVDLDLVVTSAPSEAQMESLLKSAAVTDFRELEDVVDWRLHPSWLALSDRHRMDASVMLKEAASQPEWAINPLRIPDRDAGRWESTHPLEQIRWTREKNKATTGNFVNVVKALKWWKLEQHETPKHPKGFPFERIIGECCPDGVGTVAEGVTRTLEDISAKYSGERKPFLRDYGVPGHDVLKRISEDDFRTFVDHSSAAAKLARRALDCADRKESGDLWRELFGAKFPKPPEGGSSNKGGYTPPSGPAAPGSARFA